MGFIPCAVQYIPVAYYFIHSSWYLLIPYPSLTSPLFMSTDFMEVILKDSVLACFLQGEDFLCPNGQGSILFSWTSINNKSA